MVQQIKRCDKGALILHLEEAATGSSLICRLEAPWTMIKLDQGDLVSIKPVWCDSKKTYRVDKDEGYLITLPDHLLAGTTMMGALFCRRKGALQELFKGMDADNEIVSDWRLCRIQIYIYINISPLLPDDGGNDNTRDP